MSEQVAVSVELATVYRARNGRRYFTQSAAWRGYARAAFRAKHPCSCEPVEYDSHGPTYGGYNCGVHNLFDKVFPRYLRMLKRKAREAKA